MSLDQALNTIQKILNIELQRGAVRGLDDLATRRRQRVILRDQLQYLEQQVDQLKGQIHNLPRLPAWNIIQWSQAVQVLPNLVFLELDTTGIHESAEIIRVCVVDRSGQPLLDQYARPTQPLTSTISNITGITNEQLRGSAQPIETVLNHLRETLSGKYVLSYNLEFDTGKLREATRRASIPDITVIGEDLMQRAMTYFAMTQYPKLEDLCQRIGHPLPEQPRQSILDRAHGQLSLLDAMAKAITGPATSSTSQHKDKHTVSDDDEESPF
ncbi:3`-5` exonuclease [Ktedonobacteria bacterium brp13]|nr:3`-5` exonuclease [Ktedonobacteria bacterium brp13]